MYQEIFFWEPSLSPHKTEFIGALKEANSDIRIVYCTAAGLDEDRRSLGWSVDVQNNIEILENPDESKLAEIFCPSFNGRRLHVFSGIRWVPMIVAALKFARRTRADFCIYSEPRDSNGIAGGLRLLQSIATEGWLRRDCKFVLAIGRNGPPWFRKSLYPSKKIFCFAYYIDILKCNDFECRRDVSINLPHKIQRYDGLNVLYVGRLVPMKGVKYLIDACAKNTGGKNRLRVVGDGPIRDELERQAKKLSIDADFVGVANRSELYAHFQWADVLVLPSIEKDGWGVVCSEALLAGVSVIATHHVGASIVLSDCRLGRIARSRDAASIADALVMLVRERGFSSEAKAVRARVANQLLSSQAGADYFREIALWASTNSPVRPSEMLIPELTLLK